MVSAASALAGAVTVRLADACCDLLALFRQWRSDHPAAATVAGMRGFPTIAEWVADVPEPHHGQSQAEPAARRP
ncbi:MAG TPA: hypothetical protein VM347_07400 [Nonomuraea sp.]|nr:hypothetical protein [Nonomuraea sp.]